MGRLWMGIAGVVLVGCSGGGAFGQASGTSSASGASATGTSGTSTTSASGTSTGAGTTGSTGATSSSGGSTTGSCGDGCRRCSGICICAPGNPACPPSYDAGLSEPDAGFVDAGPYDAGVYIVEPAPNTYWCWVVQGGALGLVGSDDAGCTGSFPACAGEAIPLEPEIHVPEPELVEYLTEPVPAGPHWPCWAPWGVGHAHVALPTERWLHNSEHAGVVLLYRCDPDAGLPDGGSCDAMAQPLIDFAVDGGPVVPQDGDMRYLVTARPQLPTAYAAIAWGWRLELDAWDPAAVTCFAQAHLGAGPEELDEDPDPTGCPQSYLP